MMEAVARNKFAPDVAEVSCEASKWRRYLHSTPELGYQETETTRFICEKLTEFGVDTLETTSTGTGAIATIKGDLGSGPSIGFRADIDALPMQERSGPDHASKNPGKMHACGHDGHTAVLLGAARLLGRKKTFAGKITLLFQPAEEMGLRGAKKLIEDGFLDRNPVERFYSLHCWPGLPVGHLGVCSDVAMSAYDTFEVTILGKGSHGGMPHFANDPIVAAAELVLSLQTIVSRSVDPREMAAVSVCQLHGGSAINVIPDRFVLRGSVRAYNTETRNIIRTRVFELARHICGAHRVECTIAYDLRQPAVVNDSEEAKRVADILGDGPGAVVWPFPPGTAGEDFAFFSERVRSVYFFLGNGASAPLHHPSFDFSDEAIPFGIDSFIRIASANGQNGKTTGV